MCAAKEDIDLASSSALSGAEAWSGLSCHQRAKVFHRYETGQSGRGRGKEFTVVEGSRVMSALKYLSASPSFCPSGPAETGPVPDV